MGAKIYSPRDPLAENGRRRNASGRDSGGRGPVALQNNVARLKEDHDNAAWMAEQLRAVGAEVTRHDTNMLFVRVGEERAAALGEYLRERGC